MTRQVEPGAMSVRLRRDTVTTARGSSWDALARRWGSGVELDFGLWRPVEPAEIDRVWCSSDKLSATAPSATWLRPIPQLQLHHGCCPENCFGVVSYAGSRSGRIWSLARAGGDRRLGTWVQRRSATFEVAAIFSPRPQLSSSVTLNARIRSNIALGCRNGRVNEGRLLYFARPCRCAGIADIV